MSASCRASMTRRSIRCLGTRRIATRVSDSGVSKPRSRRTNLRLSSYPSRKDDAMDTWKRIALLAEAVVVPGATAMYVAAAPSETVVQVVAKRFDYTPNVIKLKKGVPVVLELTTKDVVMGFSVPDFHCRADILPDKVARLRIVPDNTGTFSLVCDICCGTGHEDMEGTIVVED